MTRIPGMKKPEAIRCAIYTRKSTDEGLDQQFNSLDSQREACEAYAKSQVQEGWEVISTRYDDGGFSGGTLDRPALKRLIADINAGKIDVLLIYKIDRLSRSLLDFASLMATFERNGVSFVSVSQLINTASSIGKLMLNLLMSFAEFERQLISERTRDKYAATIRKGLRCGGAPMLGYDIVDSKLVVNDVESIRVQAIFALYLEHQSLITVIRLLDQQGWRNKAWISRKDIPLGDKQFTKSSLYNLLSNVIYIGKLKHRTDVHQGIHEAIINADTFDRVQQLLKRNGATGGTQVRNKFGALLKGILRCKACGASMSPSHTTKHKILRYRKYRCLTATKRGAHACPTKAISAPEIESFVVDQIKCIGRDPTLIQEVLIQAQQQSNAQLIAFETELRTLETNLRQWHSDVRDIAVSGVTGSASVSQLAELHERISSGERRANEFSVQISQLNSAAIDEAQITASLTDFNSVWSMLTLREQTRVFELLLERVEYDPIKSSISITFHSLGLQTLSSQLQPHLEQTA